MITELSSGVDLNILRIYAEQVAARPADRDRTVRIHADDLLELLALIPV